MYNFLEWLTRSDNITSHLMERFRNPTTLEEMWGRVDNITIINGLVYEYVWRVNIDYYSKLTELQKYTPKGRLGFFCCNFIREKEISEDCSELKEQVDGLKMLEELYREMLWSK